MLTARGTRSGFHLSHLSREGAPRNPNRVMSPERWAEGVAVGSGLKPVLDLVPDCVRIPSDADHDSEVMAIAIPN